MPIYDVGAKEVIYLSFTVEADSPEEARDKAHELWLQGEFIEGDTGLQDVKVYGSYGKDVG